MVIIGIDTKHSQNVDQQRKRFEQIFFSKKLWSKQNPIPNYGHFLCIFASVKPQNGHSTGSTSHWPTELIFMFLESAEQGEWENTQS